MGLADLPPPPKPGTAPTPAPAAPASAPSSGLAKTPPPPATTSTAPTAAPKTFTSTKLPSVIQMQQAIGGFSSVLESASTGAKNTLSILLNRYLPQLGNFDTITKSLTNIGGKGAATYDGVWGPLTDQALKNAHAISSALMTLAEKFKPNLPRPTEALQSLKQIISEGHQGVVDVNAKAKKASEDLIALSQFSRDFILSESETEKQEQNSPSLFETPPEQTLSKSELEQLQKDPDSLIGRLTNNKGQSVEVKVKDIIGMNAFKSFLSSNGLSVNDPDINKFLDNLKGQQTLNLGF
jgi:hypothetical protein